jgi:hypothetical protein
MIPLYLGSLLSAMALKSIKVKRYDWMLAALSIFGERPFPRWEAKIVRRAPQVNL